jgi:hypothetical protein
MIRPAALAALLAALPALAAAQEPDALCMALADTDAAQCECAAGRFTDAVGRDDAALYEAVTTVYFARRQEGAGDADAWDAAVGEVAREAGVGKVALLQRMNAAGKAHRAAIRACG